MWQREDPEQLISLVLRPKFLELQSFLDRPLSLAIDGSSIASQTLGVLKAIAVSIDLIHSSL
jgi:hypothetical protein